MLKLIGIDGDDTLWHSEGYYRDAHAAFADILSRYVDVTDAQLQARMLVTERRNLATFGYGAKGMALSMVETAIALTAAQISATDIHRLIDLGRQVLSHPVDLLPGVPAMLDALGARYRLVLITKGDLRHQAAKVAQSQLAHRFECVEIVSEKDAATYRRILQRRAVAAAEFVMVGNSLRSDMEPVLGLGGWGVHVPYRVTWAHELEHGLEALPTKMLEVACAAEVAGAVARLASRAA